MWKSKSHKTPRRMAALAAALATTVSVWVCPQAQAAPRTIPRGPWVAISGRDHVPPLNRAVSSYPHAGVTVAVEIGDGKANECTLSWPVVDSDGDLGLLTAGHCGHDGAETYLYDRHGDTIDLPPLSSSMRTTDSSGIAQDSAVVYLPGGGHGGSLDLSVATGVVTRGALSLGSARALPAGTTLCMNGARSGITCGPLIRAGSDEIEWGGRAVKGDSGAPVFVVDSNGEAMAVGMLSGGPSDTDNYVAYLDPTLEAQGLRLAIPKA